ncbi:MAG: DUF934 domain-containing protein [Paracoccaceae bacterium]
MTVIVTDTGFGPDAQTGTQVLDLEPETNIETLVIAPGVDVIRIHFPSFADGRGFTLARRLRLRGFTGHLRAHGHVLADQYAMARRSGFDDVEIDDALAARQPEDQWITRANWQSHDYQSRLRG